MPVADYTIRRSNRARKVRLEVTAWTGLTVILPRRFDPKLIPALLEKKEAWIRAALKRAEDARQQTGLEAPGTLPTQIRLQAIDQVWTVQFRGTGSKITRAIEQNGSDLLISGDIANVNGSRMALQRWISRSARGHLGPWLERLSREENLPYGRLLVRNQKTRWGSCSCRGTISLNQKLLFLPPDLVRYVLLHELCHTVHLDHSQRFWALLRSREPSTGRLDAELRDAGRFVPWWMTPV